MQNKKEGPACGKNVGPKNMRCWVLGPWLFFVGKVILYVESRTAVAVKGAVMNNMVLTRKVQVMKKQRLEREIAWIKREFKDFKTVSDIDIYNAERYASLHLGVHFI